MNLRKDHYHIHAPLHLPKLDKSNFVIFCDTRISYFGDQQAPAVGILTSVTHIAHTHFLRYQRGMTILDPSSWA